MWGFVVFNAWFIDRDVKKSIIEGREGGGGGKTGNIHTCVPTEHEYIDMCLLQLSTVCYAKT